MTNWGIIGLGRIAHKFAQDLQLLDDAHLHAVASRSPERSQAFADQYHVPHAYGTYEALFERRDLDAIYIATPHASHAELTLLCLREGIPVLCEKPFAINEREAQAMVQAARQNNTFLMEAMWTRFMPHVQKMLEWLQQGAIGELHTVNASLGFEVPFDAALRMHNPALGGGALLDLGVYPAFLAQLLLGTPQDIEASAQWSRTGVDDDTTATLHYADGKRAHLQASMRENLDNHAFLYGTEGSIELPATFIFSGACLLHRDGQAPEAFTFPLRGHGYYLEAAEVMECLRLDRKESPRLPLDFSLALMETLDRIRVVTGLVYPQDQVGR